MLSKQIELSALEIRQDESRRENQSGENYKEATRRQTLSKDLKEGSARAIKKLLASEKQNELEGAIGALSPFSEMSQSQIASHKAAIEKIDPSAQVMQLYNKLIDKLLYIAKEGIQKTTFYLDTTAFDSSVFRGAKITIVEYSTAPRLFNIEFSANTKAVNFFSLHAQNLQNALNNGGHKFNIHRIDTSLLSEDEKHALKPINRDREEQDES